MNYKLLSKNKQVGLNILLIGFLISIFVLFFVDLIMTGTDPRNRPSDPPIKYSLAESLENQTLGLSVGTEIALGVFSLLSLISIHTGKLGKGVTAKQNGTFMVSILSIIFLIYAPGMIPQFFVNGDKNYFNQPSYKSVKGIICHLINPIMFIVIYFVYVGDLVNENKYARSSAGYILIFIDAYIIYVISREIIMKYHPELFTQAMKLYPIPYFQFLNPISFHGDDMPENYRDYPAVPVGQGLSCLIAIQFLPYLFELFFNGMSNIKIKNSLKKTYLGRTR